MKVLGIGLLVTGLFGALTIYSTTNALSRSLYGFLEEHARDSCALLAVSLQRPLEAGDLPVVQQKIEQAVRAAPEIRYILVRDGSGRAIAHAFGGAAPADLEKRLAPKPSQPAGLQVHECREGIVYHAYLPILEGRAGAVEVGVTDKLVAEEISTLVRSILQALAFSVVLGTALGLLFTRLLTKPLHGLVRTTHELGAGNFDARSEVCSDDEIGQLAGAFNTMADTLRRSRLELAEKEQARLRLVDGIVQAQEEERKRLARELHDQLGQSLTGLLLTIQSSVPAEQMPAGVRDEVVAKIRHLSGEMHQLAWGLRPPILDDYGLDPALSSYLDGLAKPAGLQVDYQYAHPEPEKRLPPRVEVTLYRVAQEAVTNALQHARASRISVAVLPRQGEVTLIVEDDGQGFDPGQVPESRLGLTGLQERVSLLGGACRIESQPGEGCTVWVKIPIAGEPACRSAS